MEGDFEDLKKNREPFYASPVSVVIFFSVILIVSFAWIWRSEMKESSREVGFVADQQISLFDIGLGSSVAAIRNVSYLSGVSSSSTRFKDAVRAVIAGSDNIRGLRILDLSGAEILGFRRFANQQEIEISSPPQEGGRRSSYEEGFIDELRSLSVGEVMISDFSMLGQGEDSEPGILLGTGLFFSSGARAGFVVAEVTADDLLSNMQRVEEGDGALFIVSSDGRWVYDSRVPDEWSSLRNDAQARWITDNHPNVWKAMNSAKSGSIADDGLWVFRQHSALSSKKNERPRVLEPDAQGGGGITASPFYFVKRLSGGPSWAEILSAAIPLFVFYVIAIAVLLPAIFRSRRAFRENEQASYELREATLKTRLAMESAGISAWRIDLDAGKIETDKRVRGLLLLESKDEIRSVDDWEVRIHPQERRKVFEQIEPFWAKGEGRFSLRHRMRRGDDSWGWYHLRGAVRMDEFQGRKVILVSYLDVTEDVRQKAELDRLVMATRQTLAGIAILDKEGQVEWSNRAFREMPGREGEEIIGKPLWTLLELRGEEAESNQQGIQDSILGGEEFSLVITRGPEDGEFTYTRVVGNPVLGAGGIATHYVVVEGDVSREKKAEADLRKSENLLKESQRLAGIGSWEIDLEEDSIYWSEQIYQVFELSEDITPNTEAILSLLEEGDSEILRRDLQLAIDEGTGFEREISFQAPSGKRKWVKTTGTAHRTEGLTTKVYGVTQDVTGGKQAESALIKAREEEIVLNDQMAAALNKARLAEQKAQDASDAKSSFLSMISHEIRNPINGVIGMADVLKQTELDDAQTGYLEAIHSSGSTVVMLLDDILDFNRLEHGQIEFEQRLFSLESLIEESILVFAPKIESKRLDLGFWIDPALPQKVMGDVTRMKQILFNLLGNAVKFTERGSISIGVDLLERQPNDRCFIKFSVLDTGRGIPEGRKERIFQPFSQVDASITRRFGGSGLGLAISRELAMRMGGDLEFESVEKKGSRFSALIPFPASFEKKKPSKLFSCRAFGCFRLDARGKQLRSTLEELGMTVELCSDEPAVRTAIGKASARDFIFVDYHLIAMDGVSKAIKERASDGLRIVVVGWTSEKRAFSFPAKWISLPLTRKRILSSLEDDKTDGGAKKTTSKPVPEQSGSGNDKNEGMKILVAEDNDVNQKVIRLLLKRIGYNCTIVENGALAVEQAKSNPFDLVLMDIQMPVLDGIGASQQISREVPAERRPRIVALTAGATRDSKEEAAAAGMTGYLTKPVQASALEEEIRVTREFMRDRNASQ